MTLLLVTSRQITIGVTIGYYLTVFAILLAVNQRLKRYNYFKNRLAFRIVIAIILYYPVTALLLYTVQPAEIDRWLHELLNVPYP